MGPCAPSLPATLGEKWGAIIASLGSLKYWEEQGKLVGLWALICVVDVYTYKSCKYTYQLTH